ncbi:MAG: hypothetical protein LAT57_09770, partial [Balneolales bacterium]|nr:hypothetical protein [Balneolales bacterium]
TGNADVANEVARTFVVFDFAAPTGIATYGGQTMPASLNWNAQANTNFRMLSGVVNLNAELQNDDDDFERVRITLERFNARSPGASVVTYPGGDEVTIANLTDSDNLVYNLDTSTLKKGGLYQLRIFFEDDLGNTSIAGSLQFIVGEPQVRIAGFNPIKQQLYLSGPIHAFSARVEYSTDGGNSFSILGTYDLSTFGAATRDYARQATVSLTNSVLPDGEIIFRATGADRSAANFSEARFANAPSTLTVNSNASSVQALAQQHSSPVSFLSSAWDPGLNGGNLGLMLNKDAGDLSNIRFEIDSSGNDEEVSLFMMLDTNPYSSDDGTISTGLYTVNTETAAGDTDFFAGRLESLDGNVLGFLDNTDAVDLTAPGTNISTGGVLYVFATTINDDGEVDMRMERIMVHRIAANRGGEILAPDNTPVVSIEENVLDRNAGIYVEQDRARFRSIHASQLNIGQLGPAYWIGSPNGAQLRSGMSSRITIGFDPDELGDISPERINIANITSAGEFTFTTNARDKRIDSSNNTVSFNLSALPTTPQRYTLVVDGLQTDSQGSIEVAEMMVGSSTSGNYTTPNGSFSAIISDNLSGINPATALLYVNDVRLNVSSVLISGGTTNNAYQFSGSLGSLSLREGIHTARFLVENNSGDRLNRELEFYVDNTPLQVKNDVAVVGAGSVVSFTAYDPPVADTLGAGLDSSTVYVDIWGSKLEDEKSTTFRVLNRLSPSQLEFSGRSDSVQVAFTLPSDVLSSNFENLMFVIHNQPGVQLTDTLGLSQYIVGPADLAGNTLAPIIITSVFDRTPPDIQIVSRTVETGIRFRITDEQSGVNPESIELELIEPGDGNSVIYFITDDELTYNPSNGSLVFNAPSMGAEIILSVADRANNIAVHELIAESELLTIAELYNYPNPFNPDHGGATITFMLSKDAVVDIELFDLVGRRASRVMQNESLSAGRTSIPLAGQASDGRALANGVYFLRVVARDGDRREEQVFKTVVAK